MKRLHTVLFLLSLAVIAAISIAVPLVLSDRIPLGLARATAATSAIPTASPGVPSVATSTATSGALPSPTGTPVPATPEATPAVAPTSLPPATAVAAPSPEPTGGPAQPQATAVSLPDLGAFGDLQARLQEVYRIVNPSVVHLWGNAAGPMLFGGEEGQGEVFITIPDPCNFTDPLPLRSQGSLGSGFVWDREGHIVTNNHLLQDSGPLFVTFADGLTVPAEVVGGDRYTDLAVLKVEAPAEVLHPVSLAASAVITPGAFTVAVGNPFGCTGSMSFGIVSAAGRSLPAWDASSPSGVTAREIFADIIQTDAPINPGNSGGVLADLQGRLIGVTFAMVETVDTGVGFAIPARVVQRVVPALIEKGSYEPAWLGAETRTLLPPFARAMGLSETQRGVLVESVTVGSPADRAGLRGSDKRITIEGEELAVGGDVIVAMDGQRVTRAADVDSYLARYAEPGQTLQLTILRDGEETRLSVTVGARPGAEAAETPAKEGGAWLGLDGVTLTSEAAQAMGLPPDQRGVLIESVVSGSPADGAELRGGYKKAAVAGEWIVIGGDVIVRADGEALETAEELAALLAKRTPGDSLTLVILRDGVEREVAVTLGSLPQETM